MLGRAPSSCNQFNITVGNFLIRLHVLLNYPQLYENILTSEPRVWYVSLHCGKLGAHSIVQTPSLDYGAIASGKP